MDIQLPQCYGLFLGSPHSSPIPQRLQDGGVESAGLDHWESNYDEEGKEALKESALRCWQIEFLPAVPKQVSQPMVLLICRAKMVAQNDQETQPGIVCLISVPEQRDLLALVPGLHPPRQES